MNVCVLNFSGNVGKSTIATHLLAPRLRAPLISVETLNSAGPTGGAEVDQMTARRYGELQGRLATPGGAVVDVGSSNVEEFLQLMGHFAGSHEDFDLFVVPVVGAAKQKTDTVNTIAALRRIGVPGHSIRIVFNKVEQDDDVLRTFAAMFLLGQRGDAHTSTSSTLFANEIFEMLKARNMTFAMLDADQTDYRQRLRESTDATQREHIVSMIAMKRLAITCTRNLDTVFSSVMPV